MEWSPWVRRIFAVAVVLALIGMGVVADPAAQAQTIFTVDTRIADGADDVEQTSSGYLYTSSTDLELTTDGSDVQTIGLRFTDVQIPPDAVISAAWIEFTVDETSSDPTSLTIHGIAEANAAPFAGSGGVTSRPTTSASAPWTPGEWLAAGELQQSPDLTALVSEVVGGGGWNAGNALAFMISGTGARTAWSYNGFPGGAPLLHVEYTVAGPVNAPPIVTAAASDPGTGVATLTGVVTDDGLPTPPALSWLWSQQSGPPAVITDPLALTTDVTFSDPGTYLFVLQATDGALTSSDSVVVSVDAGIGANPLLPDLVSVGTGPGRQKFTIGDPTFPQLDGRLLLRFDGYVTNVGDGPLHVTGNPQHLIPGDLASHDVWQWVEQTNGSLVPARKVPIKFETDDDHNHFHFMELIQYDLLVGDGSTGDTAVSGRKVGFCLVDEEVVPGHPDPGPQTYTSAFTGSCGRDNPSASELVMGVTEGWQDVYGWDTNFQWFDVSDVVPGEYRIRATADPSDLVIEKNETNPPAFASDTSIVPGHAPTPVSANTAAATPVSIVLDSVQFDSPFAGAWTVTSPVYSVETLPGSGTLDAGLGTLASPVLQYTPNPGFTGTDTFTFGVRDATGIYPITTPTAAVTIEVGAGSGNSAPQVIVTATAGATATDPISLSATVTDDGLPDPPGAMTWLWSQASGPSAPIDDPSATSTFATPAGPGTYVFIGTADDSELTGSDSASVTLTGGGTTGSADFQITVGTDDVEEPSDGALYVDSSDLELTTDWSVQTIGLRFANVTIPVGATVTAAWVQFTSDETSSAAADLTVAAHLTSDATPFAGSSGISSLPRTAATTSWQPPAWLAVGAAGPDQRTPDIAAVIDEVVSLPGWASGNALSVVITGTGTRTAESFEGSATGAPILHVEWTTTPGVNTAPAVAATGTGAAIGTDATLSATASDDGLPDPPGALSYSWIQTGGPPTTILDPGAASTTAPLPAVGDYTFEVTVFDGELTDTAEVTVTAFDPSITPVVVEAPILSGTDDVEEASDGELYVDSSDLELTTDWSVQTIGLRFDGVAVPAGATIVSARIEFTVDELSTGPSSLAMTLVDSADAPQFVGDGAVTSSPVLTTQVPWTPGEWLTIGSAQVTPDLGALVADIVSQPGWVSGNALAVVISGTGVRVADSSESGSGPVLIIEYLP